MMSKGTNGGLYRLTGIFAVLVLTGCVGFAEIEEVDQAQLQQEGMLPDPAISAQVCPLFEQGYAQAQALPAVATKEGCGHPAPFLVRGLAGSHPLSFSADAKLNCVMLSQLHRFFADQVQSLALEYFDQPVDSVQVAASYSCRSRNGKKGAKLSEHARMNALDISALSLADGTVLNVEKHWRGRGRKGAFLRSFNREACKYFTTVIGPGGDKYHQDHIHLDHGKHGRKGTWRLCQ